MKVVRATSPASRIPPKQTVVLFGDSIAAQDLNGSDAATPFGSGGGRGFWTQAQLQLRYRFVLLNNAGVGGNTTAQMLARIQTDVLAYSPGYCIVQGGGNDVTNGVAAATTIANLQAIYDILRAAGIVVVACTQTPTGSADTTVEKANLAAINNWIRGYAISVPGIILCDWYPYLADPITGDPATGMMWDTPAVHQSQLGAYRMGSALAAALSPRSSLADPLPFSNAESGPLVLPNPRMVGNTAGLATSVTVAGETGTPTLTNTKVARADGIQGEWQQVVASAGTDAVRVQQQATTNVGAATTATGVNALNSATVNVGATTGFTAPGVFMLGGVAVPYTGITGTSFTGCGNHPATAGGEAVTSPIQIGDRVYAVAEVEIDAGATMVAKAGEVPVRIVVTNQDSAGSPSIQSMFAASGEGTYPGPIPTGRMVVRTPNFLIQGVGSSRLFVKVQFFLNGTFRVGRMQIYKTPATSIYG